MLGVKLLNSYVESPPFRVSKWLMADCCALCKCDVSKRSANSKRLKLYGDSAEATRKGWNCFLIKNYCWREGVLIEKLGYATSVRMKLISKLIQEINAKRDYLVKKLQSAAAFGEPTGRK